MQKTSKQSVKDGLLSVFLAETIFSQWDKGYKFVKTRAIRPKFRWLRNAELRKSWPGQNQTGINYEDHEGHEVFLFFMFFMPFMVEHFLAQKSRIELRESQPGACQL